jgi:hypothetical protein
METIYINEDTSITTFHSTPGGFDGRNGSPGREATGILTNGINGKNGMVQIYIMNQKGHLHGPYSSVYKLEVVDFDVVDSNNDGIFEFGEDILICNVKVCNTGNSNNTFSANSRRLSVPQLLHHHDNWGEYFFPHSFNKYHFHNISIDTSRFHIQRRWSNHLSRGYL